ncbi:glycosyltransferase [Trichothermofontia sp.]
MEKQYRLLIIASHPVQYAVPVFREMAQNSPIDVLVAYCCMAGVESFYDQGFGSQIKWDIPLLDGYPWIQLKNLSLKPKLGSFLGLINLEIFNIIKTKKYDAIVIFTGYIYLSFWITLLAAKLCKVPIMFGTDSHVITPKPGSLKFYIKRWIWSHLFRLADIVIVSSTGGLSMMKSLGLAESRIALTPFAVDNRFWLEKSAQVDRKGVRYRWGIPENAKIILFCGKLQLGKSPEDLLDAFIKADLEDSYLLYAGEGSLRSCLEHKSIEYGMDDRVKFLGFVNQSSLPEVYTSADLFVLPSAFEPFGVVVNEAMLCGCPVIVSDQVGAAHDLVIPGKTGYIFPHGDIDILSKILRKVLLDKEHLKELKANALMRMRDWSPKENVEGLITALKKCKSFA